jgi:hypothetical protein
LYKFRAFWHTASSHNIMTSEICHALPLERLVIFWMVWSKCFNLRCWNLTFILFSFATAKLQFCESPTWRRDHGNTTQNDRFSYLLLYFLNAHILPLMRLTAAPLTILSKFLSSLRGARNHFQVHIALTDYQSPTGTLPLLHNVDVGFHTYNR